MPTSYALQRDEQGRPYYQLPGQTKKSYVSPVAMGGQRPADTTGIYRHGPEWNQNTGKWETPLDMGNIGSQVVGTILTAGAVNAAGMPGGANYVRDAVNGVDKVGKVGSIGSTAIKYGLQYGLPVVANAFASRSANNAERESNAAMMDYYNKALAAAQEEQTYRRGFDEEGRSYGRYSDQYGRESSEEDRSYGRAGDTYGRESDEERLAYDRSQTIRDKNYGYQQYGNFVETLEPYRAGGSASASRMSQLMGGPATADTGSYLNLANTARNSVQAVPNVPDRPTWNYSGTRPTFNYAGSGQTAGAAANAPIDMVRVQAPDGEIRELPRNQADVAVKLGGRIV